MHAHSHTRVEVRTTSVDDSSAQVLSSVCARTHTHPCGGQRTTSVDDSSAQVLSIMAGLTDIPTSMPESPFPTHSNTREPVMVLVPDD